MILDQFLPKGPLLIFNAEEINAVRAMLLRSDWRCAVTDRMREFLEAPEVTRYRESKPAEAMSDDEAKAFENLHVLDRGRPGVTIRYLRISAIQQWAESRNLTEEFARYLLAPRVIQAQKTGKMMNEKAESLQSMSESGTPADLWDFISNDTEIDRHICKYVVYHMLHGTQLVEGAVKYGLTIEDISLIRAAFDRYIHEHKEQQCHTSN